MSDVDTVAEPGAAPAAPAPGDQQDTTPGAVLGTVRYMSPEQARGLTLDARTDIFSLGVVLYEMIAGRLPFDAATTADLIVAILERDPPPLTRHSPDVSDELASVVARALAKDRAERYQSATDLLTDLKRVQRQWLIATERDAPTASSPSTAVDMARAEQTGR